MVTPVRVWTVHVLASVDFTKRPALLAVPMIFVPSVAKLLTIPLAMPELVGVQVVPLAEV